MWQEAPSTSLSLISVNGPLGSLFPAHGRPTNGSATPLHPSPLSPAFCRTANSNSNPNPPSPLLSARGGFVRAARIDRMQKKPDDAMEEEAAAAPGPEIGFWLAARRRLAPEDPFFAAGDLERELLAKHVRLTPLPLSSYCPRYTHADPCCKRIGTACLGRFSFPRSLGVMQIPVRASQF
jgi:hypothetical protein